MMRLSGFLLPCVLMIVCPAASAGENWPRFRGPSAMSVAEDDDRLPDRWSTTENVAWKAEVPGWGWSSPVVWGNRVFLTTVVSTAEYEKPKKGLYLGQGRRKPPEGVHHWRVYCFDVTSGDVLWKRDAHHGEPESPRHPKSTYASETPATDGERLYVLFGDVGLYCYDLNGKPLWSHRVEPRETFYGYGAAASPVVHGDQVIMVYDNQEESYIASFDAKTGAPRWRTKRDEKSTWATPFVWEHKLRTEIVAPGRTRIRSYDLSGKLLWELDGKMSGLVIPSPFASRGLVYITSGYVGDRIRPVYAIKPGASGDITPQEGETTGEFIEWHQPKAGPYNTSPIVYRGHYYTLLDRGFVTCHDARTGKEVYGKRRLPLGATFTASPWAYNGKVFCLSEVGDTYVVKAGPEFKLLRTNSVDALCMASPAVGQGKLFIRSASGLFCFTQREEKTEEKTREVTARTLRLRIPVSWKQQRTASRMRLAQFAVPAVKGDSEPGELVIYYFPGGGGGLKANLERWIKQFEATGRKVKLTKGKSSSGAYYLADISGAYNKPVGPPIQGRSKRVPGSRALAAILQTKDGNYYLKLTGPEKTIAAAARGFRRAFGASAKDEEKFSLADRIR